MIDVNISLTESLNSTEPSSYWGSFRELSATTCAQIQQRIKEIGQLLEKFRPFVMQSQVFDLTSTIPSNLISAIQEGISGSYFLKNLEGENQFVIKPIDEDAGCINNPKYFWGSSRSSPVRDDMPLYLSSLKEAATYEVASSVGLTSIAPKTALAIFESDTFFYLVDDLAKDSSKSEEVKFLLEEVRGFSKEKLCSVQEFVPNAQDLFSLEYSGMGDFSFPSETLELESDTSFRGLSGLSRTEGCNRMLLFLRLGSEVDSLDDGRRRAIAWVEKEKLSIVTEDTDSSFHSSELLREVRNVIEQFHRVGERVTLDETHQNQLKNMIKAMESIVNFFDFYPQNEPGILLDQSQYEDLVTLIWLTYDTDAHLGNILGYKMDTNEDGKPIYGLKKIDNGLTFPTKNRYLRNPIIYFSNAEKPLSEEGRKKIQAMDATQLTAILKSYDLDIAVPAFEERLQILKSLVEKPDITLKEIDRQMETIENDYENAFGSSWDSSWNSSW